MAKGFINRIKPAKLDFLHVILIVIIIGSVYFNIHYYFILADDVTSSTVNLEPPTVPEQDEAQVVHTEKGDETILNVKSGDSIHKMLSEGGLSPQDAALVVQEMKKYFSPSKLKIGQQIVITYRPDKNSSGDATNYYSLADTVTLFSDQEKVEIKYNDQKKGYTAQKVIIPLVKKRAYYNGYINGNLYTDAAKAGVSTKVIAEFIQRYSYTIDFQRDIKAGDKFEIYYEYTMTPSGKKVSDGPLLYTNLTTGNKDNKLYRYVKNNGSADFFNHKGESVRKALLLTPINGARITSGFGMRKHPIYGYSRKHEGLDYAAPRGTPILSSGDGIVEEVRYSARGYGRYIKIRHTAKYQTLYAHLDRFAKKIKKGSRVSQGDTIGYVGSSGASTGPHLHYEVIEAGKKVNPNRISVPKVPALKNKELTRFVEAKAKLHKEMKNSAVIVASAFKV